MLGYWNNPQATSETLVDGWLRTGDVGSLDADGFLTLSDRSKDVIISGGTNIYPREVEEVLLGHPAREGGVGDRRARSGMGRDVVACVVPNAGAALDTAALDALLSRTHRALQAAEALPRARRTAEEQLRQGAENRAARDAAVRDR